MVGCPTTEASKSVLVQWAVQCVNAGCIQRYSDLFRVIWDDKGEFCTNFSGHEGGLGRFSTGEEMVGSNYCNRYDIIIYNL